MVHEDGIPAGRRAGEGTEGSNYKSFFERKPLTYRAKRQLAQGPLEVALTITHTSMPAGQSAPYKFVATFAASYGEANSVTWTSSKSGMGEHRIAQKDGFGDFFSFIATIASAQLYSPIAQGGSSLFDFQGCFHDIERQAKGDFYEPNSSRLKPEIIKDYF